MNLEELYIQRNEYARQGDIENVERITKEIEDMLPTKPKPVLTIDGKPVQFEIVDINPHFYTLIEQGLPKPKQLSLVSYGKKDPYARILIRRK